MANPLLERLRWLKSPAESGELLGSALPLQEIGGMEGEEPQRHFGANLRLGRLVLTAAIATGSRLVLQRHSGLTMVLGYGGRLRVRQLQGCQSCKAESLLVLCGAPAVWEGAAWSVVAVQLESETLRRITRTMHGSLDDATNWRQLLRTNHHFVLAGDDACTRLQRALRQQIATAADLSSEGACLLERLRLDEQIVRLLLLLLLPELRRSELLERDAHAVQGSRDPFGALLTYITNNLARELNLSELESHSHYCRRTLQYMFKERLGCTASQWIRSQRLDQAHRCLLSPQPNDSVASIARDCGYRSMNLFSIDFQQRFHIKPSQLLRDARANRPG